MDFLAAGDGVGGAAGERGGDGDQWEQVTHVESSDVRSLPEADAAAEASARVPPTVAGVAPGLLRVRSETGAPSATPARRRTLGA